MNHMRIDAPTPPRLLTANREDKELKLREFISEAIATLAQKDVNHTTCFSLVARAPDSPAARAATSLAADMAKANISLRVILLDIDLGAEDQTATGILDCASADIRILSDARFAAAHEQMSLGDGCAWIGDCMRRDPSKRDAFEIFHAGNATAARHTEASFAKLWTAAKPAKRVNASTIAPEVIHAGQFSADQASVDKQADRRHSRG
jgi:hypothetical protein